MKIKTAAADSCADELFWIEYSLKFVKFSLKLKLVSWALIVCAVCLIIILIFRDILKKKNTSPPSHPRIQRQNNRNSILIYEQPGKFRRSDIQLPPKTQFVVAFFHVFFYYTLMAGVVWETAWHSFGRPIRVSKTNFFIHTRTTFLSINHKWWPKAQVSTEFTMRHNLIEKWTRWNVDSVYLNFSLFPVFLFYSLLRE